MSGSGVERLKQKVEKLVEAFQSQSAELEGLLKENNSLKVQVGELETKLREQNNAVRDSEDLRKKVDLLIEEVDNCISLANG